MGIDGHHAGQIKEARRGRDEGISAKSSQEQSLESSLILQTPIDKNRALKATKILDGGFDIKRRQKQ